MVRRSQRRGWISRGQTRCSLPHKSSSSQRPTMPCSTKINQSRGRPLTRLTTPVTKARTAASARLQSVRRGDIGHHSFLAGYGQVAIPPYLRYLAIHKFADMIQSFLECTWIATADLGHLRLATTTAADDLSQFLCKLSGVVALLHQVGGYRHHELRPLIDDRAEDDDARAKAITYSFNELAQRLHVCGFCWGSDVRNIIACSLYLL